MKPRRSPLQLYTSLVLDFPSESYAALYFYNLMPYLRSVTPCENANGVTRNPFFGIKRFFCRIYKPTDMTFLKKRKNSLKGRKAYVKNITLTSCGRLFKA